MAFNYDTNIKNILLSMSLSPYLPTGSSVGFGFQMRYSGSLTGSLSGSITLYDDNILSTGTASLQIFFPTSSYLDLGSDTSASIAILKATYTNVPTGRADETISTQLIYAPGEITTDACSANCYIGEFPWAFNVGGAIYGYSNYASLANRQTQRGLKFVILSPNSILAQLHYHQCHHCHFVQHHRRLRRQVLQHHRLLQLQLFQHQDILHHLSHLHP